MKFILLAKENEGCYSPIQTVNFKVPPVGCAVIPDKLDTTVFYEHNGFVILTVEQVNGVHVVTAMEPNVEAWEAWKNSIKVKTEQEQVTQTPEERIAYLEAQVAELMKYIGNN